MPAPVLATVLFVVDGLGLSGKTRALVDLACGLDRFRAEVATLDGAPGPLRDRLLAAGVPVHDVPCPDGLGLAAPWALRKLIRRIRPAVLHAFNQRPMLHGGLAALSAGMRATVGSLSAFACLVPDRPYDFLPQRLATATRRNRLRNRAVARLMRALVTVSPALGDRFCRWNGIPADKLTVISYAVDTARLGNVPPATAAAVRASFQVPPDAVVAGSVGRLVEQKDYPTQLRALAAAARQSPSLYMVLAGEGPLRPALGAQARALGIADRVRFLGHRNDVEAVLAALDVYVLASRFEPYGVALLEAKAAGRAIVATAVDEIPSLIDADTGVLVPPRAPEQLAEALVRLAADGGLRRRLGAAAARDALQRHGLSALVGGYQDIYQATIDGSCN
jgi:glycosyltransferase involved in cell wall biosynthesis